jgi:hypothetical protein
MIAPHLKADVSVTSVGARYHQRPDVRCWDIASISLTYRHVDDGERWSIAVDLATNAPQPPVITSRGSCSMPDVRDIELWLDAVERTVMDLRCKVSDVPAERIEIGNLRDQVNALRQAIAHG